MGIKEKIEKLSKEAERLERIRAKFLDLDEERDRWGKVRLSAKSANPLTTDIETRHSCGCCNDSPYYAMPYLDFEGERIYASPVQTYIGEKATSYYGEVWLDDWHEKLQAIGIPVTTIDKLQASYDKDMKRKGLYDEYQDDLSEID